MVGVDYTSFLLLSEFNQHNPNLDSRTNGCACIYLFPRIDLSVLTFLTVLSNIFHKDLKQAILEAHRVLKTWRPDLYDGSCRAILGLTFRL